MEILAPILGGLMIIWTFYNIYKDDQNVKSIRKSQILNHKPTIIFFGLNDLLRANDSLKTESYGYCTIQIKSFFRQNPEIQGLDYSQLSKDNINILLVAYTIRAKCNKHNNKIGDAIYDYGEILKFIDKKDIYYNLRGNCYSELNEELNAIRDYTNAINENSNNASYFYNRGLSYLNLAKQSIDYKLLYYNNASHDGNKAISLGNKKAKTDIIDKIPNFHTNVSIDKSRLYFDFSIKHFIKKEFIYYYIPNSIGLDYFSSNLLKFKNGDSEIIKKWALLTLLKINSQQIKFDFIIRILGSDEIHPVKEKPLHILCKFVSYNLGIEFIPDIISKKRKTSKLSHIRGIENRQNEMVDVFIANDGYQRILNTNVLFIDDVLTSGTTSIEVLKCLKEKYPLFNPYLITLAKTSTDIEANKNCDKDLFMKLKFEDYGFNDLPDFKHSSFKYKDNYDDFGRDDGLPF